MQHHILLKGQVECRHLFGRPSHINYLHIGDLLTKLYRLQKVYHFGKYEAYLYYNLTIDFKE